MMGLPTSAIERRTKCESRLLIAICRKRLMHIGHQTALVY